MHRSLICSYTPPKPLQFPLSLPSTPPSRPHSVGTLQTHPALWAGIWDPKAPEIFLMPIKEKSLLLANICK